MILYGLAVIGLAYLLTYSLVPVLSRMLIEAKFLRPNYRGEEIPLGVGMVFPLVLLCTGLVWLLLQPEQGKITLAFLLVVFSMSMMGLADDVFGSRNATGLKGHFKKLLVDGELTTGALKALGGGVVAMAASLALFGVRAPMDILILFLNAFIVALSTNAVNLLDLRPGRAIKGFLVLALILAFAGYNYEGIWLLGFLVGAVAAYLPYDIKAYTMMGDTGSNVLGVSIGLMAVLVLPLPYKGVYLAMLILFHLYTEKISLTKTIENNKVLKYIDMLGRDS